MSLVRKVCCFSLARMRNEDRCKLIKKRLVNVDNYADSVACIYLINMEEHIKAKSLIHWARKEIHWWLFIFKYSNTYLTGPIEKNFFWNSEINWSWKWMTPTAFAMSVIQLSCRKVVQYRFDVSNCYQKIKACVRYFFVYSPINNPSKTMKSTFYFI